MTTATEGTWRPLRGHPQEATIWRQIVAAYPTATPDLVALREIDNKVVEATVFADQKQISDFFALHRAKNEPRDARFISVTASGPQGETGGGAHVAPPDALDSPHVPDDGDGTPDGPPAPTRRVSAWLREQIEDTLFAAPLLSLRELHGELGGVTRGGLRHAVRVLASEGVLYRWREERGWARRTYVASWSTVEVLAEARVGDQSWTEVIAKVLGWPVASLGTAILVRFLEQHQQQRIGEPLPPA
jgi:hypothetical protein